MEIDTAYIKSTVKTNPLGKREAITHEWDGKSPYVRISYDLLQRIAPVDRFTDRLQVGPYKLLLVEQLYHMDAALYVREDKFGVLRVALYKSTRLLDLIYRRMIITLVVWRLAEFDPTRIPSWRDIKVLKGFAKK